MSNSPLISNKRKTQVASDGMPHGSGWNACSLPPRKPLSRLGKKVLPKLHKRLLKRPGTPPPKQFTGRSPKSKAAPPTRQPRISPQAQRRTAERTMAGRRLDQANSREKRQPRREPLLLHPTAPDVCRDLGRSGAFGVDQDVNAPAFGGLVRFSNSDGLDPSVVQLEISYQIIADHHCAC